METARLTETAVRLDRLHRFALATVARLAPVVDLDGAAGLDDVGDVASAVDLLRGGRGRKTKRDENDTSRITTGTRAPRI